LPNNCRSSIGSVQKKLVRDAYLDLYAPRALAKRG